jgi:hypothetical protein
MGNRSVQWHFSDIDWPNLVSPHLDSHRRICLRNLEFGLRPLYLDQAPNRISHLISSSGQRSLRLRACISSDLRYSVLKFQFTFVARSGVDSNNRFGRIDISSLKSTNRVKIAFMHAGQSIVEANVGSSRNVLIQKRGSAILPVIAVEYKGLVVLNRHD